MGRSPRTDGVKKGPWTTEEDQKLLDYIAAHGGHGSWRSLPNLAGLNRCGKSCRLRWTNYLRPDIKRGNFSEEEQSFIISLHSSLGNKWSKIATHLPGRTDNEIKNYWNTHLRKKLLRMGIDPRTHRPRTDLNFLRSLSLMLLPPTEDIRAAQSQYLHNMLLHRGIGADQVPNCNTNNIDQSDEHVWNSCSNTSTGFGLNPQEIQTFDDKLGSCGSWYNMSGGAEENSYVPGLVWSGMENNCDNNWERLLGNETSALFWEDIMHHSLGDSCPS